MLQDPRGRDFGLVLEVFVGHRIERMANPNKRKGDAAERAIRDYVCGFFPASWKTRVGWDDDRGDVVLDLLGDKSETYAIQSKDVASPAWGEWFEQLASQIEIGRAHV